MTERPLIYTPWCTMSDDDKKDLIRHIQVLCSQERIFPRDRLIFVRDVILRILTEGDGRINESMDFVQMAESRGYRVTSIGPIIQQLHEQLQTPISTRKAAKIMKLSMRQVRRLAQKGIPHLDARQNSRGHWLINPISVNDWLLRRGLAPLP